MDDEYRKKNKESLSKEFKYNPDMDYNEKMKKWLGLSGLSEGSEPKPSPTPEAEALRRRTQQIK